MIKYHVSAANILLCGKKIHSCKSATPENIFGRCLEIRLALRHVLTKPRHTTFWWVGTDIAHKSSSTINKLYEGVHVCLTSITSHRSCGAVVHDAKGLLWKDQTVNTVPPFLSVVSPIFFLAKDYKTTTNLWRAWFSKWGYNCCQGYARGLQ